MVSRSEIDMEQIKAEYKKKYGKTLYKDILVGSDKRKAEVFFFFFLKLWNANKELRQVSFFKI